MGLDLQLLLSAFTCVYVFASGNVGTSGGYPVYEDRDTFYTALAAFTEDEDNVRFVSNIVYNDDGEIEASASRTGADRSYTWCTHTTLFAFI